MKISTHLQIGTENQAPKKDPDREDYVPCACAPVVNAGWQCDDSKGNAKMVWSLKDARSWIDKYCPRRPGMPGEPVNPGTPYTPVMPGIPDGQ